MLRKNAWIVALFAALAIVLMGCPPGDNGGNWDRDASKEIHWFMTEELDGIAVEDWPFGIGEAAAKAALNPIGINLAGTPAISVIDNGGDKALTVNTGTHNWGAGIDLMNEYFEFQEGDYIKVTGTVLTGNADPMFFSVTAGAGETLMKNGTGTFVFERTLSSADVSSIRTSTATSPRAIRIGAKPTNIEFRIDEIEFLAVGYTSDVFEAVQDITGVELEGFVDIPLTLGGAIQPAVAAIGKEITWSKQASPGTAEYTLTPAGLLTATTAGTALVTATVVDGIDDGNDDYIQNFTINISAAATTLTVTVDGVAQQVTITTVGAGTGAVLLDDGSGFTFTRGTPEWEGSYAYFQVNIGSDTLSKFSNITFTYKGISGDDQYKRPLLYASNSVFAGALSSPALASENNFQTGESLSTNNVSLNILGYVAPATTVTGNAYFAIYLPGQAPSVIEISNIAFVKGTPCGDCSQFPCQCACAICSAVPFATACTCTLQLTTDPDGSFTLATPTGGTQAMDADFLALVQAMKAAGHHKAEVRVTIRNNGATEISNNNGVGQFGSGNNFNTNAVLPAGGTQVITILVSNITSDNMNSWSNVQFVSYQLFIQVAP